MNTPLDLFDRYLSEAGPTALVIREPLMPVEGKDGVLFPPTYAASEDGKFKGGYNIDELGNGKNVCLIDSVGSQANRIEPIFGHPGYQELVPQITIKAGEKTISLLDAGHRAGDAIVRCSSLQEELQDAFKAVLRGDCLPLAKIAPTSLVFGAWDSRGTQAKLPRLLASTVRAYDVHRLTRSAQFVPAAAYVEEGILQEPADKKEKDAYAERGFAHVPASAAPGGVIATGGIRRDATLHLAALRLLRAAGEQAVEQTLVLQRYILGLALTAFTLPAGGYLRQGCNLVRDPDQAWEFVEVQRDGTRIPLTLTHEQALDYAAETAKAFQVGKNREVPFEVERANKDLAGGEKPAKAKGGKGGAKKAQ